MSADDVMPASLPLTAQDMQVGLKVAQVGLGTVDYRNDTLRMDALAASFFDLPAGVDIPRDVLHSRIHPDDWPKIEAEVETLLAPCADSRVIDMAHRIQLPDGTIRWVNARKQVVFDADDTPVTGVFALIDISARVSAERRSKFLIGELKHRSKNLITVVSGIARQLKRHSAPEEVVDKLIDRLNALARNQDAITDRSGSASSVREVIRQQLVPFSDERRDRVLMTGPDVALSSGASQDFAMVMHELLTNATKYGALSDPEGTVAVDWQVTRGAQPSLSLTWQERNGPPVSPPERTGFGSRVLTQLAEASLGASVALDFQAEGLRFTFSAPLDRLTQ